MEKAMLSLLEVNRDSDKLPRFKFVIGLEPINAW